MSYDNSEGIDPNFNPFERTIKTTINGIDYYGKKVTDLTVFANYYYMWVKLYNDPGVLLKTTNMPMFEQRSDGIYLFFPELGIPVPNSECETACKSAQDKLKNVGLYHADLYDGNNRYNCTNVRKVGEEYYPIDVYKIYAINHSHKGGIGKKHKTKKLRKNIRKRIKTKAKKRKITY